MRKTVYLNRDLYINVPIYEFENVLFYVRKHVVIWCHLSSNPSGVYCFPSHYYSLVSRSLKQSKLVALFSNGWYLYINHAIRYCRIVVCNRIGEIFSGLKPTDQRVVLTRWFVNYFDSWLLTERGLHQLWCRVWKFKIHCNVNKSHSLIDKYRECFDFDYAFCKNIDDSVYSQITIYGGPIQHDIAPQQKH